MATSNNTSETMDTLSSQKTSADHEQEKKMRRTMIGVIIGVIVLLILLGLAIFYLLQPASPTDKIRDVFIIVVALESLIIGVALVVLIVQLASLINLLQNEVRPILKATTDTVNNLRGTAEFLGDNVVEPVIKLNGYLAGLYRMLEMMGVKKK
jgi:amino acid permease